VVFALAKFFTVMRAKRNHERRYSQMPDAQKNTMRFDIVYDEEAITILVDVKPSPNQDKIQRTLTLEGALKRNGVAYDSKNEAFRIFLHNEGEVEKVLECFRIFEKQDKIKETKLNVHKSIAAELEYVPYQAV